MVVNRIPVIFRVHTNVDGPLNVLAFEGLVIFVVDKLKKLFKRNAGFNKRNY